MGRGSLWNIRARVDAYKVSEWLAGLSCMHTCMLCLTRVCFFFDYADNFEHYRELALQMAEQFTALGSPQNIKLCLLIGGTDMVAQAISLAKRPHIVIATPGRLADHIRSSGEDTICGLRRARFLVFDEADRLLTDSFAEDLQDCLSVLPPPDKRQTLLFTATVTEAVRKAKEGKAKEGKGKKPMFISEIDADQ